MDFVSSWWVAWMIGGAAAAAIPVVIHMIHLARAPEIPFPTLRFLRSAAERTARRRRIENILLMLLRMLLFGLLAFALSRPFLSKDFALFGGQKTGAAVLILDNSYSMGLRNEQATRFAKAKQEARAILDSPWQPAMAAIILTNPGPDAAPTALIADRAKLISTINSAQVSTGRADLVGAVRAAYALLDKASAADKRLWIVTDRQALSWDGLQKLDEPRSHPEVPVAVIRPTEPSFINVAITSAEAVSRDRVVGMPIRIDITIRNSAAAPDKRNVLLMVDDFGQALQKQPVDLAPAGSAGAVKVVSMTHTFDKAGPHRVLVALEGTDSLDVDNTRRIALSIADRVPVLVVKQSQGAVAFQDSSFYLVRALDPLGASAVPPWPIRPVEVLAAQFDPTRPPPGRGATAAPAGAAAGVSALEKYDAVILNDVAALPAPAVRALADYVARGRTLVLFCGPQVTPEAWNRLFADGVPEHGGLLPARLKARIGSAVLRNAVEKVTEVAAASPYLEDLVDSADIYQDVLVYEHFRTDPPPADSVLARLEAGDPLLVEKRFGEGRVLMFTTSATADWSTLPIRNLFMPLVMRIATLSSRSQLARANLQAGQPIEIDLAPAILGATPVEISGPLGPSGEIATELPETVPSPGHNILRFAKTWHLGYYGWRVPGGSLAGGVFATNVDGAESDLAEIADEKLRSDFGAREVHVAQSLDALRAEFESSAHRELWQYFLTICLLLAVCEPLLANWIRPADRHRSTAHPTPGRRAVA